MEGGNDSAIPTVAVRLRVQHRLLGPSGTLVREATCQIPAQQRIAAALKQQLSWQAMPRPGVRVTDVSSDAAPSCEEGIDGCWTEQIIEGDTTAAMYDPASCDNPGDGGGSSGGGGGSGGGGDDDSPSPFPPTTYPPPSYPDPPPPSYPDPPPSDPPPGGGGAGDCSQQIDPDCPDEDPPGDDDPLIAVADPLFGVVLQDCCIDCPGDAPLSPWAKAMQIGNKMRQAANRGEDLLDGAPGATFSTASGLRPCRPPPTAKPPWAATLWRSSAYWTTSHSKQSGLGFSTCCRG